MDKSISINSNSGKFFDRRLKTLVLIAFLILIWLITTHFLTGYIKTDSSENWKSIASENNSKQSEIVTSLFNEYQNNLNNISGSLVSNPDIIRYIQRSDSKKLFEEILKINLDNNYQVEIYNLRLELLAFKGRKLESDVYSLQRCAGGKNFSLIKEIGFYTYLIIYTPVYDPKDKSQISGIILTAKLIDIKYQINNKFFQNIGLPSDISKILGVTPEIFPANNISGKIDFDSVNLSGNIEVVLIGIDHSQIGILLLPEYSQVSHSQEIEQLSKKITSLLIFGITIIFFLICLKILSGINSHLLKFTFFVAILALIRFIWIEFSFPSKSISSEIFSPGFYASTFGFGVAKSLGEFFITSILILAVSIYGASLAVRKYSDSQFGSTPKYRIIPFLKNFFLISVFFALIFLYGSVIQSIIFDSNLKFFDRSSIIPGSELFIIQLIIVILTFSLFTFLITIIVVISDNHFPKYFNNKVFGKYSFLILLLFLLCIFHLVAPYVNNFKIDYINCLLIIVFSFSLGIYISGKLILFKNYNVFSVKYFSIVILFCIVTIPGILLDKITSQETFFVELIGKKIIEKEDDKIKFLLLTELSNISENKKLENNIKNKNKLPELAFSVWADSKFSEENFNTAILILDTNKKMLSDFIFNSQILESDSVLNYANDNFFKKKTKLYSISDSTLNFDTLIDAEEEDEILFNSGNNFEIENLFVADKIVILKNEQEKYYLGIVPIEKIDLKNTAFETNLGYLVIAVQYESKNFLLQSSLQLFKNYSKDNLFDKLISSPVITEYVGGEIVSSNNQDLSKANTFSLDAFRETIKFKNEKFDWRYEIINNERFRTLYILAAPDESSGYEKIYSISLKRNDFKLTVFFYLKFILFVVFIYLIVLAFIAMLFLFKIRKFRFNFREKLFTSFFIVSVIPIVLLAIYTRSFIKNKYDSNFQNEIISDLNLVSQSLKGSAINIVYADSLNAQSDNLLGKTLNRTDKNFNLFLKTKLVSTTDEELYKSDLLDTRVDADAYYNIVFLRKDFFSKNENIGVYSFVVGYKPLFDLKNNIIGLISSQNVYKQNEINEELTEILTFIFGIYFIVIIVLLVFVTILTDKFSSPILKLQNATERVSLGESNVELNINRKDEIGTLVDSFNRMTKELESSKNKLKRVEREAAWRDIARRVAHEIKNPLTPMKLSIQHLEDVYNKGNEKDFSEVLKKTRNIIIKEIEKLNRIATEFSDFAKLPRRNYEEIDLNDVIEEVLSLYRLVPGIEFKEFLDKNIDKIYADRHELNRVFQNIIKNSIQAIESNGIIEIKTYQKNTFIYSEIIDNGTGIDKDIIKNLFDPNFSTKSTGMGLGLAITKKTIDDMKAEITLENSETGTGTRAVLKFISYNFRSNGLLNN